MEIDKEKLAKELLEKYSYIPDVYKSTFLEGYKKASKEKDIHLYGKYWAGEWANPFNIPKKKIKGEDEVIYVDD